MKQYTIFIFSAFTPCNPNPCLHQTKCTVIDDNKFSCDCYGSGYQGDRCQLIQTSVDPIPNLNTHNKPLTIQLYAKPNIYIQVRVLTDTSGISIYPEEFTITHPDTRNEFQITATRSGKYIIQYEVTGLDAKLTIQPPSSVVYVTDTFADLSLVNASVGIFELVCETQSLSMKCLENQAKIQYKSSCGMYEQGLIALTTSSGLNIPLSAIGSRHFDLYGKTYIDPIENIEKLILGNTVFDSCSSSAPACQGIETTEQMVKYFIAFGYYPRAVMRTFSKMLFVGASLSLPYQVSFSAKNLRMIFSTGQQIPQICDNGNYNNQHYFLTYTPKLPVILQILSKEIQLSDRNKEGPCFVYDLCEDVLHISMKSDIDVTRYLEDLPSVLRFERFKLKRISFDESGKYVVLNGDVQVKFTQIQLMLDGDIRFFRNGASTMKEVENKLILIF